MRLEVAFTPSQLLEPGRKVCVVIDVLRATSSIVTMFGRGLSEALVAETVAKAEKLAVSRSDFLLCGERRGLPPEGFDYGNSPGEFAGLDLTSRGAIVVTTNGTRALARSAACPVVLVAALLNARAVVIRALGEARASGGDMVFVCAGQDSGRSLSLEDAFCAGALVEEAVNQRGEAPLLSDSAKVARRLYRSFRGSALAALQAADHGRELVKIGFGSDLEFCARRDVFSVVPRLSRSSDGLLRLSPG